MNKIDLSGRCAVVTGGAQGFGLSISKRFIESGAKVMIWDIDKNLVDKLENQLDKKSSLFDIVDVTDHSSVSEGVNNAIEKLGKVDIFVNNAGITGPNNTTWEYPIDDWKKVIDVDLNGVFYCTKSIVPHMIKNNYGRIVNIASVSGKDGNANASAYSSAKAGVLGLTKSLGKELAEKNIAVNAVTPAGAKTRILDQMSKEHVQRMLSKVPRGRFLELNELTSLVCWLSSEENSFSTAAVFDISGGRSTY